MTSDRRPDPDQLLEAITGEFKRQAGGRLRIFFGACAGVGKTYAMLQAAHRQQESGVHVCVGVVETHDRAPISRLLDGLPQLPARGLPHQSPSPQEFDLDGALALHPDLVLIDELAHANAPGSRHGRRWQDVEELLRAGISVYTTLNVQQLESLNDVVGDITGIRVREVVPDQCFDAAHDVVLVDLSPEDLLHRLEDGEIYPPAAAQQARNHFFRKGNLVSLRELALRRLADRVSVDVRAYRNHHAIDGVWPTDERLLVCVRADVAHEKLIREGSRLAQRLRADWMVVHVDESRRSRHPLEREALLRLAKLAESLGAEFLSIPGEHVADALLECVRTRNATRLVLGHREARWRSPWRKSLARVIAEANPEVGLILLQPSPPSAIPRKRISRPSVGAKALLLSLLACGLTTFVAALLLRVFDLSNVVMLFLLTVVLVALRWGKAAGALAALVSVASFDFFFVPPILSFHVSDTQYIFTFVLMLVVALVTGQLAARLRSEATLATAGERRATALARVARDLSAAMTTEQIVAVCTDTIAPMFASRGALMLPDLDGRIPNDAAFDAGVAQWVYEHVQPAGHGKSTLASADAEYLPLKAPLRTRGVLALRAEGQASAAEPDDRRLLDACCALIALALERIHFVDVARDTLVRMEGERLRHTLLAAVSHDLKTPLTAIRGMAETLETMEGLSRDERDLLARSIHQQADALHRLVVNLLDLARMQSDGVRLNLEWHAVSEIVGSALASLGTTLGDRRVHVDLPADLPLVELDANPFERVLVNLLDNAAKYTPAEATIWIRAMAMGDTMYLCIDDDGPGLPSGSQPEALFEPFTRGVKESSITGVGLGLALCRSIVAAHGGTIEAMPLMPRGARFEIRLPIGKQPEVESEMLP
ncbi:sensor histidine kinase KdpD [Rhodanobacter sp. MP7CTX1]|uniref:sensor histidine kinase n=1 Tax=Rhodanobacter sp. MP7CTX1 TaxID=2723084 RepID=UPI0016204F6B|nr:sensor histidine kinase KdpD [Rhodanobacter sp. MP7CTX1]MBB6188102.1 two-component system sensor histidine kinase KdpD [Rhodanobacter sp. MP7CTX1]